MGVIFQNGVSISPSTVFWDNNYKSMALATYPDILGVIGSGPYNFTIQRSSVVNGGPGVYSILGTTPIYTAEKRMITFRIDDDNEPNNPNYAFGFGTRNTSLNDYIGTSGSESVGIFNTGDFYFNDSAYSTGLPTFGNVGDIIDVAIEGGNGVWYRVNGGDWNNDPVANPATNTNVIDMLPTGTLYPALTLWGQLGPSIVSVFESSPYGLPSGFTQIPGDRTGIQFTITSDSFNGGQYYGAICGNGTGDWVGSQFSGFTVNNSSNLWCGVTAYLSGNTLTQIANAYTAVGATPGSNGYIFDVVWGTGSTVTNGVVKFIYTGNNQVYITPVDPSDTRYLNNDNNPNNGTQLVGTFNFPATFTFRLPLDRKGGWC